MIATSWTAIMISTGAVKENSLIRTAQRRDDFFSAGACSIMVRMPVLRWEGAT